MEEGSDVLGGQVVWQGELLTSKNPSGTKAKTGQRALRPCRARVSVGARGIVCQFNYS